MPSSLEHTLNALEAQLNTVEDASERLRVLTALGWQLRFLDVERCITLSEEAMALADEHEHPDYLGAAYRNLGFGYHQRTDVQKAHRYLFMAHRLFDRHYNRLAEAETLIGFGLLYFDMGETEDAIVAFGKALTIFEETKDPVGKGWSHFGLGLCSLEMHSYDQALEAFEEAERLHHNYGDPVGRARAMLGIGVVHRRRSSYGRALHYTYSALNSQNELSHRLGIAEANHQLALIYTELDNLDKAMGLLQEAHDGYSAVGYAFGETAAKLDEAYVSMRENKIPEAIKGLEAVLPAVQRLQAKSQECRLNERLAEAFATQKQYEKAYQHHVRFSELYDQVRTDEARARLRTQQINAAMTRTRSEAEQALQHNNELRQTNAELENSLMMMQDSITYASRIQNAMLPKPQHVKDLLPNSFVYFKPRDIVSGDFYWITEWNDYIILAAVDCTGHGVPGAFMSLLGQTFLNQIVREAYVFTPASILDRLDAKLNRALHTDETADMYDGMEAAVLTINLEDRTVQYAGANIPLYIVNKKEGLRTIKPTASGLGGIRKLKGLETDFKNHILPVKRSDTLYLFSDGYRDQFGIDEENTGKLKFSTRRFQKLLIEINELDLDEQCTRLEKEFEAWKGKLKQLDDVMVIGLRF